jgi:RimJ/RimL family protein N-acetyltransferase
VVAASPRLETERLVLRRWDLEADLDSFSAMCADPEVMRYIADGSTQTRAQCVDRLRAFEEVWREQSFGLFAVELLATGEMIGFTGLAVPEFLPEIMPAVEIGWRLARDYWGYGYATEGARAVLAFGFDQVGLERLVSVHAVGNDASGNVMRKIGMNLERETTHPTNGRGVRVYEIERPATR